MKPKRSNNQKGTSSSVRDSSSISPKSSGSSYGKKSELPRNLVLSSSANNSGQATVNKTLVHYTCTGCKKPIKRDKYLLKTCNNYWHEDCLRCDRCHGRLGELGSTLYIKSGMNLCRKDYLELFGETGVCSVCEKLIRATEMVMRAKQNVYHLECFACQMCNERFCVGDRFYLCENKVICQYDFEEHILPIQKSMIAQSEASNYYSRQQTSMNLAKDQQFSLLSMQQEMEHQNNHCQQGSSLCNQSDLNEICDGRVKQEQNSNHHQSYRSLITIQHGDNNTTGYIQLDDFRTGKSFKSEGDEGEEEEGESGSSLKAVTGKKDDANCKQSKNSKEGLSKDSTFSIKAESLFCGNHNNNIGGDDDNTSLAIREAISGDKASTS